MGYYGYGTSVYSPLVYCSYEKIKCDIAISFVNGFRDSYDVKDEQNKASMYFQTTGSYYSFFRISNNRGVGGRIWIHRVEIWGGTSNRLNDLSLLYVENINKEGKIKITNGSQNNWGLDWSKSEHTDGTELYFKKPGTVRFYFYIKWEDKEGTIRYQWFAANIQALSNSTAREIKVYDKVLQSISVSGQTTSFYKNSTFSLGSGVVKATYKYPVDGSLYEESVFSNYTTDPVVGAVLVNQSSATISFKNQSVTYPITIHGINEDTTFANLPKLPEYIKLGEYTGDLENTVVTYDDNTTTSAPTNVSALVTPGFVGYFSVVYNAYASKTKQFVHWGEKDGTEIVPYAENE